MVQNLLHAFCMSPDDSPIVIACEIQNREDPSWGTTRYLRSIFGEGQASHNSIIISLKDILTEIHLPDSEQLIWASSDAKTRTNY